MTGSVVVAMWVAPAAVASPWARGAPGAIGPALLETHAATDHAVGPPPRVELPLADDE